MKCSLILDFSKKDRYFFLRINQICADGKYNAPGGHSNGDRPSIVQSTRRGGNLARLEIQNQRLIRLEFERPHSYLAALNGK